MITHQDVKPLEPLLTGPMRAAASPDPSGVRRTGTAGLAVCARSGGRLSPCEGTPVAGGLVFGRVKLVVRILWVGDDNDDYDDDGKRMKQSLDCI